MPATEAAGDKGEGEVDLMPVVDALPTVAEVASTLHHLLLALFCPLSGLRTVLESLLTRRWMARLLAVQGGFRRGDVQQSARRVLQRHDQEKGASPHEMHPAQLRFSTHPRKMRI